MTYLPEMVRVFVAVVAIAAWVSVFWMLGPQLPVLP
jgi:hypothetical protein